MLLGAQSTMVPNGQDQYLLVKVMLPIKQISRIFSISKFGV